MSENVLQHLALLVKKHSPHDKLTWVAHCLRDRLKSCYKRDPGVRPTLGKNSKKMCNFGKPACQPGYNQHFLEKNSNGAAQQKPAKSKEIFFFKKQ